VLMAYGKRVIIVPGYGMAVAQAQGPVRELMRRPPCCSATPSHRSPLSSPV